MNAFDKYIKKAAFKKFDIIEKEHAPYYVEFDHKKIEDALEALRKRKEKIRTVSKMPRESREKVMELIDDILMLGTVLGGSHMLKLKKIEEMTQEKVNEINNEKNDMDDFVGE